MIAIKEPEKIIITESLFLGENGFINRHIKEEIIEQSDESLENFNDTIVTESQFFGNNSYYNTYIKEEILEPEEEVINNSSNTSITNILYYVCDVCFKQFVQKELLQNHLLQHSSETKIQYNVSSLNDEQNPQIGNSIKKENISDNYLKTELSIVDINLKTELSIVDIKHYLNCKVRLENHNFSNINFVCQLCDKIFSEKKFLQKHKRVHITQKPNCCTTDEFHDINLADRQNHLNKCTECDYKTKISKKFNEHKLKHSYEQLYKCNQCSYKTLSKCLIKRHKLKHFKKYPYSCTECNFKTKHYNSIRYHKLRHIEGLSFKCNQCEHISVSKYKIEKHKLTHLVKNPYYDNSFKFNWDDLFRKNRLGDMEHSIKKLFNCLECDFKTHCINTLKSHKICVHEHQFTPSKYAVKSETVNENFNNTLKTISDSPPKYQIQNVNEFNCDKCEFTTNCLNMLKSHKICVH